MTDLSKYRAGLLARRNVVGANTEQGMILSNLAEQTGNLADYERPPWATHPMQTLPGLINWQLRLLR